LRFCPVPFRHDDAFHPRIEVDEEAALREEVTRNLDLRRKWFFFSHPTPLADSKALCQAALKKDPVGLSQALSRRQECRAGHHEGGRDELSAADGLEEEQPPKDDAAEDSESALERLEYCDPEEEERRHLKRDRGSREPDHRGEQSLGGAAELAKLAVGTPDEQPDEKDQCAARAQEEGMARGGRMRQRAFVERGRERPEHRDGDHEGSALLVGNRAQPVVREITIEQERSQDDQPDPRPVHPNRHLAEQRNGGERAEHGGQREEWDGPAQRRELHGAHEEDVRKRVHQHGRDRWRPIARVGDPGSIPDRPGSERRQQTEHQEHGQRSR